MPTQDQYGILSDTNVSHVSCRSPIKLKRLVVMLSTFLAHAQVLLGALRSHARVITSYYVITTKQMHTSLGHFTPMWLQMYICLAGLSGIEPEIVESKSTVLPLHYSPTKSRIVKDQGRILSHVDIIVNPLKQKTLDFHRGFW